jgi:DNA-binding IclR family transcriptional regulator
LFTLERPRWTLTEVATVMGLSVSTVHRLLKSLLAHELLVVDPNEKRYSLGPGVMRMAKMLLERDDIQKVYEASAPFMSALRASTGETVGLHRVLGNHRACVAELVSFHTVRTQTSVGGLQPLHAGAASKSLIAWMSVSERDRLLPTGSYEVMTAATPRDRQSLESELRTVREHGYAVSCGESVSGAAALSAPIFDGRRNVVAALNITGPVERWTVDNMQRHVPELLDAVRTVSTYLGFDGTIP